MKRLANLTRQNLTARCTPAVTMGTLQCCLGASKYLSETRNFDGQVVVIFQPAEEGGAGAKAMIDDGLMDRWKINEVYGLHNMPWIANWTFCHTSR